MPSGSRGGWARVRGRGRRTTPEGPASRQKGPPVASTLIRRLAPGALSLALLLGGSLAAAACSDDGGDVSKEKFLADFSESSGLNDDINRCIVDELFAQLDQEQINDFYGEEGTVASSEITKAVEDASSKCNTEAVEELRPSTSSEPEGGTETTDPGAGPSTTQPETTEAG